MPLRPMLFLVLPYLSAAQIRVIQSDFLGVVQFVFHRQGLLLCSSNDPQCGAWGAALQVFSRSAHLEVHRDQPIGLHRTPAINGGLELPASQYLVAGGGVQAAVAAAVLDRDFQR